MKLSIRTLAIVIISIFLITGCVRGNSDDGASAEDIEKEKQEVEEMVIAFTKEFFSFYGKSDEWDVGGLEYVDPDLRDGLTILAHQKFYHLYPTILEDLNGLAEFLPKVAKVEVLEMNKEINDDDAQYAVHVKFDYEWISIGISEYYLLISKQNNTWVVTGVVIE